MKRPLLLIVIFGLIFSSCASQMKPKVFFDESLPPEKTAWISTSAVGTVTSFNDIPVNWRSLGLSSVQIPAGDTLLEMDVDSHLGGTVTVTNTKYTISNALILYTFRPQKKYFFLFDQVDEIFGVQVYVYELGENVKYANKSNLEKHHEAFVPFLNLGDGRTVLN